MAKEVKNRISLDASRFTRGTNTVKRNIKQLERGLTIDFAKAARIGKRGIVALGVATAAAGAGIAAGVKHVINLGAELDHLSTQTGMAVKDLAVLQQAFEDNGVSADSVGKSVSRLQRRIVKAGEGSASYKKALEDIGLASQDLINMSPGDQFRAVAAAISEMENQSEKTKVAMELFGNEGARLMGVFSEGAIDDAADSLGRQAQLLDDNSKIFERAGTLLDRAGKTLQGFFVGIADKVVPVILPLLERLDKLDLSEQGQKFGEGLQKGFTTLLGLLEGGSLGDAIRIQFIIAGKSFVNAIARGLAGVVNGLVQGLGKGIMSIVSTFGKAFKGIARVFSALILEGVGKSVRGLPFMEDTGRKMIAKGALMRSRGQTDLNEAKSEILGGKVIDDFLVGIANGMADLADFDLLDVEKNKKQLKAILEAAVDSIPQPTPGDAGAGGTGAGAGAGGGEGGTSLGGIGKRGPAFAAASNLTAIGGGGGLGVSGVESLVDQSQRQTKSLSNIDKGIHAVQTVLEKMSLGGPTTAVFE